MAFRIYLMLLARKLAIDLFPLKKSVNKRMIYSILPPMSFTNLEAKLQLQKLY